jgi:hypothetical protein
LRSSCQRLKVCKSATTETLRGKMWSEIVGQALVAVELESPRFLTKEAGVGLGATLLVVPLALRSIVALDDLG